VTKKKKRRHGNGSKRRAAKTVPVTVIKVHSSGNRYVGTVAAMEEVVPGQFGQGNVPGLCAMFLVCYAQSGEPQRHAALWAFNRQEDLFTPKREDVTHQFKFGYLLPDFDHHLFSDITILEKLDPDGGELMMQFTALTDEQCANIIRELAQDLCDAVLPDRISNQREEAMAWGEYVEHYHKKHTGESELISVYQDEKQPA
jgi:hypothetical protein